jgi:hypothetical protein
MKTDDSNKEKIKKIISLLTLVLSLDDREIIFLALEEAIDMLKDLDQD